MEQAVDEYYDRSRRDLFEVQSGGRDIKKALDDGETLVIETTD